jgi:hypothetical protein
MEATELRETPLFKEMDESFSRQCQWSHPKSVALLGATYSAKEMSDNYIFAAETLCKGVQRNDVEDYTVLYPVLFLFRHAIELRLKALIHKQKGKDCSGHNLWNLLQETDFLPMYVKNWIYELNQVDPRSTGLRYHNGIVNGFEVGCELGEFVAKMRIIAGEIDYLCSKEIA